MQKVVVGIFSHPDDEAFGPSATLIKEAQAGAAVVLICATRGERGMNPDNHKDLGAVRLEEWHTACDLIGAAETHNLGYADGSLCNAVYGEIVEVVERLVRKFCDRQAGEVELCFMTFDLNGMTGHLDHIAMSSITTQVFYRLKAKSLTHTTVKELAYYCLSEKQQSQPNPDYFVFMPAGRKEAEITRRVEARELLDKKYSVIRAHHSQREDAAEILAKADDYHAIDNFIVISA